MIRQRQQITGDPRLERCFAIAFTQLRFIRCSLKATLKSRQLWEDFRQELITAAIESYRAGFDPDCEFREIKNLINRKIYRFLCNYGFSRHWDPKTRSQGKGFGSRELRLCYLDERRSSVQFGENAELILWFRHVIITEFGRTAWEEVMDWARSSKSVLPPPRVAEIFQFVRRMMAGDPCAQIGVQ